MTQRFIVPAALVACCAAALVAPAGPAGARVVAAGGASTPSAAVLLPGVPGLFDPMGEMTHVSCAAPGDCSAIGDKRDDASQPDGLLWTETSGVWAPAVPVPVPPGAAAGAMREVQLQSLSCPAPGDCSAVGSYVDSSNDVQGLLLTETAGVWSPGVEAGVPTGAASDPYVELESVSCASPGDCTAVGQYSEPAAKGVNTQGVIYEEVSGTWGPPVPAPLPPGGTSSLLSAVSCPSAGNCTAAGFFAGPSGHDQGLAEEESAGVWSAPATVTPPAGATTVWLRSISCPTAGNCTAAGTFADGNGPLMEPLVVNESSGSWEPAQAVLPPRVTQVSNADLFSVSCAAPGDCTAGGFYFDSRGAELAVLVSETAGVWGPLFPVPLPGDAQGSDEVSVVESVSCPTAASCGAVGFYHDTQGCPAGLLVDGSPGHWHATQLPPVDCPGHEQPSHASVGSVSCPAAGYCVAVGSYINRSGDQQPLAIAESAGKWTRPQSEDVEGGIPWQLLPETASCVRAGTICTFVGQASPPDGRYQHDDRHLMSLTTASGRWKWQRLAVPPSAAHTGSVGGLSCSGAGSCSAVGYYARPDGTQVGLVLREVRGVWRPGGAAPEPPGASLTSLAAVSCIAGDRCTAVGSYVDASGDQQGLVLSSSRGRWSIQMAHIPFVTGAHIWLTGVSCTSRSSCTAVGSYYRQSGAAGELALREVSGRWQAATRIPGPADAAISSVACRSPEDCTAVGRTFAASGDTRALVLTESAGKWARGPATLLQSKLPSALDSVSCRSAGNCLAVGWTAGPGDTPQALALTETSGKWAADVGTLAPSSAYDSWLTAVSCSALGRCTVGGTFTTAGALTVGMTTTVDLAN